MHERAKVTCKTLLTYVSVTKSKHYYTSSAFTYRFLQEMLSSGRIQYSSQIFFGALIIVICLLPRLLSWHLKFPTGQDTQSFPIIIAISSKEYLISLISSASMSFHVIVDIFGHSVFSKGNIYSYRNFYSKILIILFLVTPDLAQLFIVIPNLDFNSYFLFRFMRYLTFSMITFVYLTHCGGNIWSSHISLNGLFAIQIGFTIKYYSYFLDTKASSFLMVTSLGFQAIGTFLTAVCTYRWCKQLYQNIAESKKLTSDQYCCNIYLLGFWMVCTALWFQSCYFNFPTWYDINTSMAVGENCYFTVFYVLITVFEGHAVRMEALTSQVIRTSDMCI